MKLNNSVKKWGIVLCILICLCVIASYFIPKIAHAPVYINKEPRPTGASRTLSESTVTIQPLTQDGSVIDGALGVGTFISSDGYLLTAKHVIESGVYGVGVVDDTYTIINERIILHPKEDIALMKLYAVTAPCVAISSFSGDTKTVQDITHPTDITPGMSGTPLYSDSGHLEGIIVKRDQTDTKKGQGVFLSPSTLTRIESHLLERYTESCTVQ